MKKLVLMLAVAFSMTMFSCTKAENTEAEAPAAEEVEVVEEVAPAAEEVAAPAEGEEVVAAEGEAVEAPAETPAPAAE
ncbi:MAG: hypothetical protein J6C67_06750 [Muribaculaceae bacterium]|nr:hypothetical protein [Muribaculaceae bacterium]